MSSIVWRVEYQVGTYSGTVDVVADENSEYDHVVALAKRKLYRNGHPGPCYEVFKVFPTETISG